MCFLVNAIFFFSFLPFFVKSCRGVKQRFFFFLLEASVEFCAHLWCCMNSSAVNL